MYCVIINNCNEYIFCRWIAWPMVWFSILASLVLLIVGKWEKNLQFKNRFMTIETILQQMVK